MSRVFERRFLPGKLIRARIDLDVANVQFTDRCRDPFVQDWYWFMTNVPRGSSATLIAVLDLIYVPKLHTTFSDGMVMANEIAVLLPSGQLGWTFQNYWNVIV